MISVKRKWALVTGASRVLAISLHYLWQNKAAI